MMNSPILLMVTGSFVVLKVLAIRSCSLPLMTTCLRHLSTLDTICVDGTFHVCPSLFTQLFSINGFLHGQQFPLVYALLPSKSRNDYNRFFTLLREEMQTLGLRLEPEHVMADFKISLVQSIELQCPQASIKGCYFHFSQCLWKRSKH